MSLQLSDIKVVNFEVMVLYSQNKLMYMNYLSASDSHYEIKIYVSKTTT